jgi:hypothetical protein
VGILITILLVVAATAQEPFEGLTLISVRTSNNSYLIDLNYNVVQTWHGGSSVAQVAYMLPDGSLLRPCGDENAQWGIGGAGGRLQKIDANDNVVWDYLFSNDDYLQHHDVEPMPNGNVLVIAWERKTEAEAIAAGRQSIPYGELWPTLIAELEPVGATDANIVWEWHLWDHLIQDVDPTKDNYGVVGDHPELVDINWAVALNGSWDHANAIDYDPELDQILFCSRAMSEVYIIDHSTTTVEAAGHTGGNRGRGGDILYRWGNPQVYDRGTAEDQHIFSIHGANWIDPGLPGEGNILIFNNGNRPGGANDYSGVVEIIPPMDGAGNYLLEPDQPFGPALPIWEYEDPPYFYSENKGGAYRLPSGNTLITEANANYIFEVTPAGTTVWSYITPGEAHRAKRYWDDPSNVVQTLPNRTRLEQNFPNPFNPATTIQYEIATEQYVNLTIYDVAGDLVRSLVGEVQAPRARGYTVTWDGKDGRGDPVASGVYFYRLVGKEFSETRKMVIVR